MFTAFIQNSRLNNDLRHAKTIYKQIRRKNSERDS